MSGDFVFSGIITIMIINGLDFVFKILYRIISAYLI